MRLWYLLPTLAFAAQIWFFPIPAFAQSVKDRVQVLVPLAWPSVSMTSEQQQLLKQLWYGGYGNLQSLKAFTETFILSELRDLQKLLKDTYFTVEAKKKLWREELEGIQDIMFQFCSALGALLESNDPRELPLLLERFFSQKDAVLLLSFVKDEQGRSIFFTSGRTVKLFWAISQKHADFLEEKFDDGEPSLSPEKVQILFSALTYYPQGIPKDLQKLRGREQDIVEAPKPHPQRQASRSPQRDTPTSSRRARVAESGWNFFSLSGFFGN